MQSKSLEESMGIENYQNLRAQLLLKTFKLLKAKSKNGIADTKSMSISEIICMCCECAKKNTKSKNNHTEHSDYELTLSYFMWICGEKYYQILGPNLIDNEKV